MGVVYVFAGISKINYAWLFEAQPLRNWLKHQTDLPIIGELMQYEFTAYLFSWGGALFDLFIVFILINNRFRVYGYALVILFHCLTAAMFPIGVFPYVMIVSTLIFFSPNFHENIIAWIQRRIVNKSQNTSKSEIKTPVKNKRVTGALLGIYIFIQLLLPVRYLAYPGDLFWTEQGYRFSWRVMLIEKAGYAQFFIHHPENGMKKRIDNKEYLTPQQEKMMSTQPDMILQFAHHLRDEYSDTLIIEPNGAKIKIKEPKVTAEVYVSLFNKGSRLFIDPKVNLSKIDRGFHHKDWILRNEK